MQGNRKRIAFSLNSPAVLGFVALCVLVRIVAEITGGASNRALFSVYGSSAADPLTYVRLFGHVLGHADWSHLFGNMMYILLLGPMIEEKYGTRNTLLVMAVTAAVTGIVNMLLFPNTMLLGASGIVFAFILMASITVREDGKIPVTFILVAVLYIGQQVFEMVTRQDNVSQLTHILGGAVGSVLGFLLQKKSSVRRGA